MARLQLASSMAGVFVRTSRDASTTISCVRLHEQTQRQLKPHSSTTCFLFVISWIILYSKCDVDCVWKIIGNIFQRGKQSVSKTRRRSGSYHSTSSFCQCPETYVCPCIWKPIYIVNNYLSLVSLFLFLICIAVYAIREAAAMNLKKLVEKFGKDWAKVSSTDIVCFVVFCLRVFRELIAVTPCPSFLPSFLPSFFPCQQFIKYRWVLYYVSKCYWLWGRLMLWYLDHAKKGFPFRIYLYTLTNIRLHKPMPLSF